MVHAGVKRSEGWVVVGGGWIWSIFFKPFFTLFDGVVPLCCVFLWSVLLVVALNALIARYALPWYFIRQPLYFILSSFNFASLFSHGMALTHCTLSFFPPTYRHAHCRHNLITSAKKMASLDFQIMSEAATRQWLLEGDRSWALRTQDKYGHTVLHAAAGGHSTDFVAWLVDDMGADVHSMTRRGRRAIHIARSLETLSFLLARGVYATACDDNGWTPLMHHALMDVLLVLNAS